MPWIHTYALPIFLQPLPLEIPRPYEVLRRPGMSGVSVLFHAPRFEPFTLGTLSSANGESAAYLLASRFAALRQQRVLVDDGIVAAAGTLVLDCRSQVRDAGLVIGGAAPGDTWEVSTTWTLMCDPDAVSGGAG